MLLRARRKKLSKSSNGRESRHPLHGSFHALGERIYHALIGKRHVKSRTRWATYVSRTSFERRILASVRRIFCNRSANLPLQFSRLDTPCLKLPHCPARCFVYTKPLYRAFLPPLPDDMKLISVISLQRYMV